MDGAIPEELLVTNVDRNRIAFPENMRDDIIETVFEIDIDILPPPPPTYQREVRPRAAENAPVQDRWFEEAEGDQADGNEE